MYDQALGLPSLSPAVTAAGVDHVRLSYHYIDSGDIDGLGSLLDERASVERPDAPDGRGRSEVLRVHGELAGAGVRHRISRVVAQGDCVAVLGRFSRSAGPREAEVEFADFFTISPEGMLLSCRRFYFATPDGDPPPDAEPG